MPRKTESPDGRRNRADGSSRPSAVVDSSPHSVVRRSTKRPWHRAPARMIRTPTVAAISRGRATPFHEHIHLPGGKPPL